MSPHSLGTSTHPLPACLAAPFPKSCWKITLFTKQFSLFHCLPVSFSVATALARSFVSSKR